LYRGSISSDASNNSRHTRATKQLSGVEAAKTHARAVIASRRDLQTAGKSGDVRMRPVRAIGIE